MMFLQKKLFEKLNGNLIAKYSPISGTLIQNLTKEDVYCVTISTNQPNPSLDNLNVLFCTGLAEGMRDTCDNFLGGI